MNTWLYRVLNADAKTWPYHVENRPEQRNSIKRNLERIRNVLACKHAHQFKGYTGENSLNYACLSKWNKSGYATRVSLSRYSDAIYEALIKLGVPTIDCRSADFAKLCKVSISGPMIAIEDREIESESHALAYRPLREVAQEYKAAGCVLYNL